MPKFTFNVHISNAHNLLGWNEEFVLSTDNHEEAEQQIKDIVADFNASRPAEADRVVEFVALDETVEPILCNWTKKNLVTNRDGTDTYQCTECGKCAKRHGFSNALHPIRKLKKGCEAKL